MKARTSTSLALGLAMGAMGLAACDDSQTWHEPDFSLARMQEQPRVDPFDEGMSAPPPFTVARAPTSPARGGSRPITRASVERGREHFETLCAACHGMRGDGDSVVATKMLLRRPPSLLEPRIRALSDVQLSEVIARGYGLMASFENELPAESRAETVAYVRALQIAQGVEVRLLPAPLAALAQEAP